MRDVEFFIRALEAAPVRELRAVLARRVPMLPLIEFAPVEFLFTSGKANRYNPPGVWCVYFAEDEATAAAEYHRHGLGRRDPVVTYFAEVGLGRIVDLCSAETVSSLGLRARDLRAPWVGTRRPTPTQCLGEAVSRQSSVAAIRFPSEAAKACGLNRANVVIFRHCVRRPDFVRILGPTKRPLQKWP